MIVLPTTGLVSVVDALVGAAGYLDSATCDLFTAPVNPGPGNVYADFVRATFDGYVAAKAITWGTTFVDVTGAAVTVGSECGFYCTGSTTPNIVYGYYVHHTTTLMFAEAFPAPIPVTKLYDAVIALPRFSFGQ